MAEAEDLLSSALGLDGLDLAARLFYERPYADLEAAARFDAEYFSPRTQNLLAALSRDGLTLGDIAKLAKRRFRPKPGVEFQYIEIADVTGNGTAEASPVAGEEAPSRATQVVKPGDVITTTVRPIRRLSAIITDDQNGQVCSSGFAVLTPRDIAPELLLVYLRLPLICELLDLHTTASMYPAISTADLMTIPIALPDAETQAAIAGKVRESFAARRAARRLLDEAKRMVEDAILGV
jgi:restriction endonuclease S subunit